jgi:hypothetical protein
MSDKKEGLKMIQCIFVMMYQPIQRILFIYQRKRHRQKMMANYLKLKCPVLYAAFKPQKEGFPHE